LVLSKSLLIEVKLSTSKSAGSVIFKSPKKTFEPELILKINSKLFSSINFANEDLIEIF